MDISGLDAADKTILIYVLQEKVNLLKEKNKRLETHLKISEAKLYKNGPYSSKPLSNDGGNSCKKPKKATSSCNKSDLKPGGQPRHKGQGLGKVSHSDESHRMVYMTQHQLLPYLSIPVNSLKDPRKNAKSQILI